MQGSTIELDLRGLRCPLPALHTRRALGRAAAGDRLIVHTTDPLAGIDIPHLVRSLGDRLESVAREGEVATFVIGRTAREPQS